MKHLSFICLFCGLIFSNPSFTQDTPNIPGAYNDAKITDKGVQDAANFAVQQMNQGILVKITSAQMQVVAGKNYSINMILDQNGVNYQYHVIVFVPLPSANQPMQLTNIEALGQVASDTSS